MLAPALTRPTPSVPLEIIAPQPGPQAAYVACPVFDACYGGARGGGKTFGSQLDWIAHEKRYGRAARGLFIRRTLVDLEDTIETAKELFTPLGATWHEQKSLFRFPSGAVLRFRYLERDADAGKYQGHSYTRVYVEELTQFADPAPIDKLKATLRSAAGVQVGFRATCNPGGPGHGWVKKRYIDPGPWRIVERVFENPFTKQSVRIAQTFIPARLSDNPKLLDSQPQYVAGLYLSGSEQLVRAWLLGDWDIVEGAFFGRWRAARNVARPFAVPVHWLKFRSFDWGYATPFSVGWHAVASDDTVFESATGERLVLPRGGLVRYREWYGCKPDQPNVGLERTAQQLATGWFDEELGARAPGILDRDAGDEIAYSVADPSIFSRANGPSIARKMAEHGVRFRRADNRRVARRGALGGWNELRNRIDGQSLDRPMYIVFEDCRDFTRTVPVLQHSKTNFEDLDTNAEDHAADDARYACMSQIWIRNAPEVDATRALMVGAANTMTFNDLAELRRKGDGDEDRV